MTFEEFSMSVQYPNREEQFYKYYEHHVALFRLMCQYMNASSGFEISIQEKENGINVIEINEITNVINKLLKPDNFKFDSEVQSLNIPL